MAQLAISSRAFLEDITAAADLEVSDAGKPLSLAGRSELYRSLVLEASWSFTH